MTENKGPSSFEGGGAGGGTKKRITFAQDEDEVIPGKVAQGREEENEANNVQTVTARDSLQRSDIVSARNETLSNYLPPVAAGDSKMIKKNPSILRTSSQYEKNPKRQLQNEVEPDGKQQTRT